MLTALPRLQQRQSPNRIYRASKTYQPWHLNHAYQIHTSVRGSPTRPPVGSVRPCLRSTACRVGNHDHRLSYGSVSHALHDSGKKKDGNQPLMSRDTPNETPTDSGPRYPSRSRRKDVSAWIELLDRYLPAHLQGNTKNTNKASNGNIETALDTYGSSYKIRRIIQNAESYLGTNIIEYMILHGRPEAASHIIDILLRNLSSQVRRAPDNTTPSNIVWPGTSLEKLCSRPIRVDSITSRSDISSSDWTRPQADPRYVSGQLELKDNTMTLVLSVLGALVVKSMDLDAEKASQVINTVLLIIGKIHNLDLVPENVYAYNMSSHNCTVQRPPILHLVSSRILTALSDAAWRDQQNQLIANAASHGISYKEIGRDPPGGRFRLKVRPLEPEVWLEFLLWCCVEGGFTRAGARIVQLLSQQVEKPWFAVTWSPNSGTSQTAPVVDWDRVRLRHGGSVGLIEGYSREKPFVEMPPRTISTEVVLGLVESSIDCDATKHDFEKVQSNIADLLAFLEPHDVPIGYFNYLAVRYLQSAALELVGHPQALYHWYGKVSFVKSLVPAQPQPLPRISYQLDSLSAHSEVFAGILHQAIGGFVQTGDVYRALSVFNDLQKLVDASKLQAIGAFLDGGLHALLKRSRNQGHSNYDLARKDFVGSHGQLSTLQLIGLLDLATDTHLIGFGQWLLFNDDPDGALISDSAFSSPSMAGALFRFASLSKDRDLFRRILLAQDLASHKPRKSTVKFLRAQANSFITVLDFRKAKQPLIELGQARGGGYGLVNLAHLAGTILRLEEGNIFEFPSKTGQLSALNNGEHLLRCMLQGDFNFTGADFTSNTRTIFKQQVACLLEIFQFYTDSILWRMAERYKHKFRRGNDLDLSPKFFDIVLSAVVETRGAKEGIRLWNRFCATPDLSDAPADFLLDTDLDIENSNGLNDESWEQTMTASHSAQPADADYDVQSFIPFEKETEPANGGRSLNERLFNSENTISTDFNSVKQGSELISIVGPPTSDITFETPSLATLSSTPNGTFSSLAVMDSHTKHGRTDHGPVTVPTLRTLRIIVRRAIRDNKEGKISTDDYNETLDWAKDQYAIMGLDAPAIGLEIQARLNEEDIRRIKWRQFQAEWSRRSGRRRKVDRAPSRSPIRRLFSGGQATSPDTKSTGATSEASKVPAHTSSN